MPRVKLNTTFKKTSTASAAEFNYTNAVVNEITDLIDSGALGGTNIIVGEDPDGILTLTIVDETNG